MKRFIEDEMFDIALLEKNRGEVLSIFKSEPGLPEYVIVFYNDEEGKRTYSKYYHWHFLSEPVRYSRMGL